MEGYTEGTGFKQEVAGRVDRIPEFDPRTGDHLWIMATTYRCFPEKMEKGEQLIMDTENLLLVVGPGCFYCEQDYSKNLASRRCKGHP